MNLYDKTGVYTYNGEDHMFEFKTYLSASEKVYFVNSVSNLLIGENYNSVLRNLLADFFIIDVFTNVDTSWIFAGEEDDNANIDVLGEMENLVYGTNIVEIVKSNDEYGIIEELEGSLDLNIEYRTGIHKNPITESLARLINTFEKKVGDFDMDGQNLMELASVLGGVSDEFTMENLLNAYAKSDMYKNGK